jgi:hypothetical protein
MAKATMREKIEGLNDVVHRIEQSSPGEGEKLREVLLEVSDRLDVLEGAKPVQQKSRARKTAA